MVRNLDKIQLPTNITDIAMLAVLLKVVKDNEPLTSKASKILFQEAKKDGKRQRASKGDTHTEKALYTYGLIRYREDKSFEVTPLGDELLGIYDSEGKIKCSEEEKTALMLKVFDAWHADNKKRDIHPGRIILKLLCEEELDFYITEHEVAHFISNPDFKEDSQYEDIKKYILDFRKSDGISAMTKSSKSYIFMPSLVNNWNILEKDMISTITLDAKGEVLVQQDDDSEEELDETLLTEIIENEDLSGESTEGNDEEIINSEGEINADNLYNKMTQYKLTALSRKLIKTYKDIIIGRINLPKQIVYFGAPGTGKSYGIENDLKKKKIEEIFVYRVIFYSDYSYGDFVGSLRPQKVGSSMEYNFVPGPLTKALKCAFENPSEQIYLIIEEINRGSAAAIFGDLFQLLDRSVEGKSKYKIRNAEISSIICNAPLLKPFFKHGDVWFPSNFNILCTMNTADQNVFILDSAFKRRFHMEYVPINFEKINKNNELINYRMETDVFSGNKDLVSLFKDTVLTPKVEQLQKEGVLKRNWPTFATLCNTVIDIINQNEGEQISEDKKLGAFYVLEDELTDKKKFADKVLYYLKQDVFKYIDTYFRDSYQTIYDEYMSGDMDVFSLLLQGED